MQFDSIGRRVLDNGEISSWSSSRGSQKKRQAWRWRRGESESWWFQETVPQNWQLGRLLRNTQGPGKFRPIWRGGGFVLDRDRTRGEQRGHVDPGRAGPLKRVQAELGGSEHRCDAIDGLAVEAKQSGEVGSGGHKLQMRY